MLSVLLAISGSEGIEAISASLDSLCNQGLGEMEILCVCREDSPFVNHLSKRARKDSRLHIISSKATTTGGLLKEGFSESKGKAFAVLRCGDTWSRSLAQRAYEAIASGKADIVITPDVISEVGRRPALPADKKPDDVLKTAEEGPGILLSLFRVSTFPWNKIYSASLYSEKDSNLYETSEWAYGLIIAFKAFARSTKVIFCPDAQIRRSLTEIDEPEKLSDSEETELLKGAVTALEECAAYWDSSGLLDKYKTEYLEGTKFLLNRMFFVNRFSFFKVAKPFKRYFDRFFSLADLSGTSSQTRNFYRAIMKIAKGNSFKNPVSLWALYKYTIQSNYYDAFGPEAKERKRMERQAKLME